MNVLPEELQEPIEDINRLLPYEAIFLKVRNRFRFEQYDIERNNIFETQDANIPNYVTIFMEKLEKKPLIHSKVRCFFDMSGCCSILTVSAVAGCIEGFGRL
jgi:hypothetical protein